MGISDVPMIQTFIFVHNQDIILDYMQSNKFSNLSDVKYVFVGMNETNKIENLENVIICKNLKYNLETYPKLTSFTGWYALWKNDLLNCNYLNLFEYDVNLSKEIEANILFNFNLGYSILGFVPLYINDYNFINHPQWIQKLETSISHVYGVNLKTLVSNYPNDKIITMTSNHSFTIDKFNEYMEWIDPMVDNIKSSNFSGHEIERSISVFYLLKNINYTFLPNLLHHFQFDSHKTQGISENKFIQNYNKLLYNN